MNVHPHRRSRTLRIALAALGLAGLSAAPVSAQWSTAYEQLYLPAEHNWAFREHYRTADRLFNAFDYGHAILYETLYRKPNAPASLLEEKEYDFITKKLLIKPPRVPLEESAIEVEYAKLVPEAKIMFDWAHILHRQIYDIWADERIPLEEKDARVAEVLAYYKSRPDIAFSSRPKSMELMEGQYYSTAFGEKYPKFNGLIWAYHWLQVGLYEPLVTGRTPEERQLGVTAAVARFWQMLENPPENMPRLMPMTAAVAPEFARRYPEVAIIFDNLHAMHDVVSDILASPKVPREKKREEILKAAARYRDDTSFVMTEDEWREMALAMGVENMGGPAVGFVPPVPEGTVPRGAVMARMDHSRMPGPHGQGARPGVEPSGARGAEHAALGHGRPTDHTATGHGAAHGAGAGHGAPPPGDDMSVILAMHERLLADRVIRERVLADTALHRMMMEVLEKMPAEHRERMMQRMHGEEAGAAGQESGKAEEAKPAVGPDSTRRGKEESAAGRRPVGHRNGPTSSKPARQGSEAAHPAKPGHTGHQHAPKPAPKTQAKPASTSAGHTGHTGHP